MPYFSVVIPLYNKENFVADTIQSVLNQTFDDFEVIIVNDVSTDRSLDVALTFSDERIRIITHKKNSGLSASRNTGIKNATALYIAFLDADDLWKPQFLEKIYELTLNYPEAELFGTKYEEIYPGNTIIEHPINIKTGIVDNFFKEELKQHIYCYSSFSAKKETFSKTGFFDEKISMGEDVDFNLRANLVCSLAYCNEALATITMHSENQITHSKLSDKTIIDHDHYEKENPDNADLKKYLDFHRYTMAKRYKLDGNKPQYKKLAKAINLKNLNYKQITLLYAPVFVLNGIKRMKRILIKKGLNPTTY
ncbi:glycosyltransferase family 2 protein [Flavobacterium sp. NRK1]|uniref:glycosyltransferase family 2 protein n=1 Tax=Flavobacterium sp. NRK1 TaxID=2954929 RepID=UPI0020925DBE|nr:glycosyltransferase family 2 protein [Flavobacterium sp. NRK1]MCO6148642.1 glycosyltransferase [Flavobacterium sp. NRK1]